MEPQEEGKYEAPTAMKLADGRWSLYLDYYGVPGKGQGYVPFLADCLADGHFERSDAEFSFPYGFKHGMILPITMEEYERIKAHDWSDKGWEQKVCVLLETTHFICCFRTIRRSMLPEQRKKQSCGKLAEKIKCKSGIDVIFENDVAIVPKFVRDYKP